MSTARIDIASIRREEIIDAATEVIVQAGIQKLSLSAIEERTGMSRGQLTYYFKSKDEILLAVFDRLVQRMQQRVQDGSCAGPATGFWQWLEQLLGRLLTQPLENPEFGCLQYTFLAQAAVRDDFRERLARLYDAWRTQMAADLSHESTRGHPAATPRNLATLVQALIHGLMVQRSADPQSFDGREMMALALDFLETYLLRRKDEG